MMPSKCTRNITKEVMTHLEPAPTPSIGEILQVRAGKIKDLYGEPSGIYKQEQHEPVFVTSTGLTGDQHVYGIHGGYERAVMAYNSDHYPSWRCENSPHPDLFQPGSFGENLVITGLKEENVCIGDIYQIGEEVILEVSEGRNPCYKLNKRFQWPMALRRVTVTARVGWLNRVLHSGYVKKGDKVTLLARPHPKWSILNVKRVIQSKSVPLALAQELSELAKLTVEVRGYAEKRLLTAKKPYKLVAVKDVTNRVKRLTFELNDDYVIHEPRFPLYSFARIEFGPAFSLGRSYSITSGDMNKFCLGVALDDHSRGGSAYIHKEMKIGDKIMMVPGNVPKDLEDEAKCTEEGHVENRIVIIGGIGVTAFLNSIEQWEADGLQYEVHYAARTPEDAAFVDKIPLNHLTIYAKALNRRLDVDSLIPPPDKEGNFTNRIFACGPTRLMDAITLRTDQLHYPDHLVHFESFGSDGGVYKGPAFSVKAHDPDSEDPRLLTVTEDKSLLRTLIDAGFEMTYLCEVGGCGACKVRVCGGRENVRHQGTALPDKDKGEYMLSCVSRGVGPIEISLED